MGGTGKEILEIGTIMDSQARELGVTIRIPTGDATTVIGLDISHETQFVQQRPKRVMNVEQRAIFQHAVRKDRQADKERTKAKEGWIKLLETMMSYLKGIMLFLLINVNEGMRVK